MQILKRVEEWLESKMLEPRPLPPRLIPPPDDAILALITWCLFFGGVAIGCGLLLKK